MWGYLRMAPSCCHCPWPTSRLSEKIGGIQVWKRLGRRAGCCAFLLLASKKEGCGRERLNLHLKPGAIGFNGNTWRTWHTSLELGGHRAWHWTHTWKVWSWGVAPGFDRVESASAGQEHKHISPGLEWTLQIKPGHGLLSWNWPCPRGTSDKGERTTAGISYRWTFRCGGRVRVP